ncbi:MAG: glycosyltransferase [Acidobacteriota bacterium]
MSQILQSLWIGPALSCMEVLSIRSFLAHGYRYHLYTYDEVADLPAGAELRDAAEILPRSKVFRYREGGSFAGFSNFFRYRLLLERGGWWVDTDVVCVRPFDWGDEHVFASELAGSEDAVTTCVIKAPPGSPVMAYAWEVCRRSDPRRLLWGETGPALLGRAVREHDLEGHVRPPRTFCPLPYDAWRDLLDPARDTTLDPQTRAVHLWHERWRSAEADKNGTYAGGCLFERLKARYLSDPNPDQRVDSGAS